MKIGELAAAAGCDVQTVRYYERSGLLPPPARTSSNYRAYGPGHVERLRFIRQCRALDMGLAEIRQLLSFLDAPDENCRQVNEVLDEHIGHVQTRIEELVSLEGQLKALRRQCRQIQSVKECGILGALRSKRASGPLRKSHMKGTH